MPISDHPQIDKKSRQNHSEIYRLVTASKNTIISLPSREIRKYNPPSSSPRTQRLDLFSLGVTLYELLSGEKPFTGETVATLMYRIANAPHPPIEQARADLPAGCRSIIDRALEKDPNKRYQRGSEMAAEIRALAGKAAGAGA